jgi:prepilin-type N-terminal cleavage/methylation domain-containing protein
MIIRKLKGLRDESGFTLIEIMVGLALFAVVALPTMRYLYKEMASTSIRDMQEAAWLGRAEMEKYLAKETWTPENRVRELNGKRWELDFSLTGEEYKEIVLSVRKKQVEVINLKVNRYVPQKKSDKPAS